MSMPRCIIRPCIVLPMKRHELIDRLVTDAGGALPVAQAMGAKNFQGTLYRIAKGQTTEPSRESAQRIAKHFNIPVDALYDDALATKIYAERFGAAAVVEQPPPPSEDPPEETPSVDLVTALRVLGEALSQEMAAEDRQDAADLLSKMALRNGAIREQTALAALLSPVNGLALIPSPKRDVDHAASQVSGEHGPAAPPTSRGPSTTGGNKWDSSEPQGSISNAPRTDQQTERRVAHNSGKATKKPTTKRSKK